MNVQAALVNMVAHVQISLTDLDVVVLLGLEDRHAGKVSDKLWIFSSFLPPDSQSVDTLVRSSVSQSVGQSNRQLSSRSVTESVNHFGRPVRPYFF